MNNELLNKLAETIFPDIKEEIIDLEKRYPPRNTIKGALVTRFAPSPTGFLHLGSLFTALIGYKVAKDSRGVFYLRVEDTDTKREVEGSSDLLVEQLTQFGIRFDEGHLPNVEAGIYGPYLQSNRANIYKTVIKHLIKIGKAYPCFCSKEELDKIRKTQENNGDLPGYYGKYAKCAHLKIEDAIKKIKQGLPYVIRYRSNGNHLNKMTFVDEIRGEISIAENDLDVVILKGDGLPTYHFAHVVDDHFMRTTTVIRGEEWIASTPIHVDMFNALGFSLPQYVHLPVIMKMDGNSKRKLSKRKDKEASVENFLKDGYPVLSILNYLMSIANSNYEEWVAENKTYDFSKFKFSFSKISLDGVLFDIDKLNYFAKEIIASMSAKELYSNLCSWAKKNNKSYLKTLKKEKDKTIEILNIEREVEKPRKDYYCYSMIYPYTKIFYNEEFNKMIKEGFPFDKSKNKENIVKALNAFLKEYNFSNTREDWFNAFKNIAQKSGYAASMKDYKNNPDLYLGSIADFASYIRIALFLSNNSPNLYDIFLVLGRNEVIRRVKLAIEYLK